MGAPLYRVTVSRLTTRGAIDSGVALVWVPVHSAPLLLTVRALANASLRDVAVRATPHARIVTSAVCACGAWYARSRGSQLPSVSHLNCLYGSPHESRRHYSPWPTRSPSGRRRGRHAPHLGMDVFGRRPCGLTVMTPATLPVSSGGVPATWVTHVPS